MKAVANREALEYEIASQANNIPGHIRRRHDLSVPLQCLFIHAQMTLKPITTALVFICHCQLLLGT